MVRKIQTKESLSYKSNIAIKDEKQLKEVLPNHPSPVGFKNIGNTCFYNSLMQCLIQTNTLRNVLKVEKKKHSYEENRTISAYQFENCEQLTYKVPALSQLMQTTLELIDRVYDCSQNISNNNSQNKQISKRRRNFEIINPQNLFYEVAKKSKRFTVGTQDDSASFFDALYEISNEEDKKSTKKRNIVSNEPFKMQIIENRRRNKEESQTLRTLY